MGGTLHHQILMTVVAAICAGTGIIVFARRLGFPAIILLLAGGFLLGPEGIGIVNADSLGPVLPVFVSLAVGVVLFEGGLTLDLAGYRSASRFIQRLISQGALITWFLTAGVIYLIASQRASFALLAASLVVVTGPTVITPLLKRIRLKVSLETILRWEAVLIDPIGVFIAVLCFEWIIHGSGGRALANFALRTVCGLGVGMAGGLFLYNVLKYRLIPEKMVSVGVLGGAVLTFGVAETLLTESGLLASIVGGLVLAARRPEKIREILRFKEDITDLMIGMLFILLASRLKVSQFEAFGWTGLLAVAVVVFAIRPISIMVCARGLAMDWREKLFLAWIAPRGIVAASMASLVRITLEQSGVGQRTVVSLLASLLGFRTAQDAITSAAFVEVFTYSVIVTTIVLHGFSAGPMARLLGLQRPPRNGWLVVGGHRLGWELARFIGEGAKLPTFVVDANPANLTFGARVGIPGIESDARDTAMIEQRTGGCVGNVVALTDNEDLNAVICQRWSEIVGARHVYRWHSGRGMEEVEREIPGLIVWPDLPKPGITGWRIARGEAHTVQTDTLPPLTPSRMLLALAHGSSVSFEPERAVGTRQRREAGYLVVEFLEESVPSASVI